MTVTDQVRKIGTPLYFQKEFLELTCLNTNVLTLVTLIVKFPEGVDGGDERNPEETPTDPPTFPTSKMMPEPRLRRTKELASKETSLASFTDTRNTLESTKEGIDCNLWLNGYKKILMKKLESSY